MCVELVTHFPKSGHESRTNEKQVTLSLSLSLIRNGRWISCSQVNEISDHFLSPLWIAAIKVFGVRNSQTNWIISNNFTMLDLISIVIHACYHPCTHTHTRWFFLILYLPNSMDKRDIHPFTSISVSIFVNFGVEWA
jgi:hypothetical protein